MIGMFVAVIWMPLYRHGETAKFVGTQNQDTVQVDVVKDDGKETRSWTIADRKAISRLSAGMQTADYARGDMPAADEKYRLRIKRADSRIDEYEVVLGSEGRQHDRVYLLRSSNGKTVYGTAFNTPELRSALQQVLAPAPTK